MRISDVIKEYIVGDWGEDSSTTEASAQVFCIRGADMNSVNNDSFDGIPIRYVQETSVKTKRLQSGDIVIEKSGGSPTQSTGRTAFISDSCFANNRIVLCSNFCAAIRIKEGWNPRFVFYYLQFAYDNGWFFNFEGKTSGIKNLQMESAFNKIAIPELSLDDQNKTVEVLLTLEKKRNVGQQIISELKATAQDIYNYWFIQYDFPSVNGRPYRSSGGQVTFHQKLKTEIPCGWDVKAIEDVVDTALGGTPSTKRKEYWDGHIPWLSSGEMTNFPVVRADVAITEEGMNNSATELMPAGSVAISITRYIRPTILAIDACANQSVVGLLESNTLKKEYLYPYLQNQVYRYLVIRTGAQQPHINKDIINKSLIVIPPPEILEAYYYQVKTLYDKIIVAAKEVDEIKTILSETLPMLMNGQAKS